MKDAGEILALQKLAYQKEAARHNDFSTPPLHQTFNNCGLDYWISTRQISR